MKTWKGAPVKGAIVHGVLLLVMLVYGYKVWTRDKTASVVTSGTVVLWDKPEAELVSIEYAAPNRTVKLERRTEGKDTYWWGTETKETPPPPPPPSPGPPAPAPGTGSGSGAPATGAGSAAKPPAAGAGSAAKPPAAGAGSAAKAAAGSAAPGPAKMPNPDLLAYQPAAGGPPHPAVPAAGSAAKPAGSGSAAAAKPAAGSGSAAKPPAAGSGAAAKPAAGSGSAAKPPAAGSGATTSAPTAAAGASSSADATDATDPLAAAAGSADKPAPVTTTREFPAGDNAVKVVKGFTAARAIRDLGKITDDQKKEYKLDDTSTTLSVVFKSGTKSFVIGNSVFGGRDKYVLDTDSGKAYVLSGDLVAPFEQGESGLRLNDPRGFDAAAIDKVAVAAGSKARTAVRMTTDAPKSDDPHAPPAGKTKTWGDVATGKPDQTLANFVDNADRLKPTKYESALDPKAMIEVVKLTYQDAKGGTLGTVTLYKRDKPPEMVTDPANPPPSVTEYYVMTEKTRVPGLVPKSAGEKIDQDIQTIFPAATP